MRKCLVIIILFLMSESYFCQSNTDTLQFRPLYRKNLKYLVKTAGGIEYSGFLTQESKNYIVIENIKEVQKYEIKKSEIISIKPFSDKKVYDDVLGTNYHAQTYMFSSSSIIFEKPDVNVNYQWLIFENINYSLGKHWDITMNTIFIYPTSLGVKCAYKVADDIYFGGNVFGVANVNGAALPNFLLGYGGLARLTKGSTNKNFSFSGGVLGINSALFQTNIGKEPFLNLPFASFAYANRFAQKWALCAESFYFPQVQTGFGGLGFKFLRDKNVSWTFGCFTYMSLVNSQVSFGQKFLPIPFIGYSNNLFTK